MDPIDREADADRLSAESLGAGDPTGWFERLYAEADQGAAIVPWDRGGPNPMLVEWARGYAPAGTGHRGLVVGCGLGEDAAFLAGLGLGVTAFDIAPSAIAGARQRFPRAPVDFRVANLLEPPSEWHRHFDFVLESFTIQALPVRLRSVVIGRVAGFVAPGGTALVLAAAREPGAEVAGPPWPLTRDEVESFAGSELRAVRIDQLSGPGGEPRWRAEFRRAAP